MLFKTTQGDDGLQRLLSCTVSIDSLRNLLNNSLEQVTFAIFRYESTQIFKYESTQKLRKFRKIEG